MMGKKVLPDLGIWAGDGTEDAEAILMHPVEYLGFTPRLVNCLKVLNVHYAGDLVQRTESELLEKLGRGSLSEIQLVLTMYGLALDTKLENWQSPGLGIVRITKP